MKNVRFIGMALSAALLSFSILACSEKDNSIIKNDDGVITNQKKLMEIKETTDYGYVSTYSFSYDDEGKLKSVVHSSNESANDYIVDFTWGNNLIISTTEYGTKTYTLSDNLVEKQQDDDGNTKKFTYNSSNQLIKVDETTQNDNTYSHTYTWNDEKIIKYTNDYSNLCYEYTYNGKTCQGWFLYINDEGWDIIDDDYIFFAHPELVGMRTNQLPEQIYHTKTYKNEYYDEFHKENYQSEDIYEDTTKFNYTLNKDGYIESSTVTSTNVTTHKQSFFDNNNDGIITDDERNIIETDTYTNVTIYSFTWE